MTTGSRFAADVGAWARRARGDIDVALRKVVMDMSARIILMSPVDTGRFRGNWLAGVDVLPEGVNVELYDAVGQTTLTLAKDRAQQFGAGHVFYLVNNLPYARALEYGWSKQAPAGMVRLTITEYQAAGLLGSSREF